MKDVDFDVKAGQFISILGHNGSGKSTLAKHINALLLPTEGSIWIDGTDTKAMDELWKIRQKAGMVFQNPDNQIIGTVVEDDISLIPLLLRKFLLEFLPSQPVPDPSQKPYRSQ